MMTKSRFHGVTIIPRKVTACNFLRYYLADGRFPLLSRVISAKIRSFPNRQAAVKSCNMVIVAVDLGRKEEPSFFLGGVGR